MKRKVEVISVFIVAAVAFGASGCLAQSAQPVRQVKGGSISSRNPSPGRALLYSLILPGLGHYYVNPHHWGRGQFHLAAEAVLWTALLSLEGYSHALNTDMYTYAQLHTGKNIRDANRRYRLAVGDFNSLQEYNGYQSRARNWDDLYPATDQYEWQWDQQDNRLHYQNLVRHHDKVRNQIPAIIVLMVANRVISGISAYLEARHYREQRVQIGLAPAAFRPESSRGIVAQVSIGF